MNDRRYHAVVNGRSVNRFQKGLINNCNVLRRPGDTLLCGVVSYGHRILTVIFVPGGHRLTLD